MYVKFRKNGTDEPISKARTQNVWMSLRQTQNGWMDPEWKKGGEMSWEILTDVYTLPYIK